METFGQRLVSSRQKCNLSQKELAEQLGITPTRLNYWEKDKREPAIEMIKAIAQILDVDTNYLIGYQAQNRNAPLYSSEAEKLAYDYDTLDSYGKRVVRLVVDAEKVRCAEQAQSSKVIKIAGRDGRFTEVRLTDDQIKDLQAYIDQLPDPGEDL